MFVPLSFATQCLAFSNDEDSRIYLEESGVLLEPPEGNKEVRINCRKSVISEEAATRPAQEISSSVTHGTFT
jgi:hypothetical protein